MLEQRRRHGNRKMLYLVDQYKKAHPEEGDEINPHLIAPWAISRALWERPPLQPEEMLRRLLARALRDDYTDDPQGREVRKHHAVLTEVRTADGIKKYSRWYTIFDAPPDHMRQSLALRRRSALADVLQLKLDFESYNENNKFNETIPAFDFDFNRDIAEAEMPTDYPNEAPDGEDDLDESDEDEENRI